MGFTGRFCSVSLKVDIIISETFASCYFQISRQKVYSIKYPAPAIDYLFPESKLHRCSVSEGKSQFRCRGYTLVD